MGKPTKKSNKEETVLTKSDLLIREARKWVGTVEAGGNNKGAAVEAFQRAVDGKAQGEPWCMAFVQFCLKAVGPYDVAASEHCLTVWNRSPRELRLKQPEPGCLMIWRHKGTDFGHVGIVTGVCPEFIQTIEGNTAPHRREVERQGDGVYELQRSWTGSATMEVIGWLKPWKET